MKRLLALACLLAPAVASAQTVPAPGAAASALARALLAAPASDAEVGVVADAITRRLLQSQYAPRGAPCDQTVAVCREAAARIAHDAAIQVVKDQQAERATVLAFVIEDAMNPADITQAMRFAETPAGKSLAAALTQSDRPR